jgi:ABC-type branched-subunit amino acid transport system substrate-binding protein
MFTSRKLLATVAIATLAAGCSSAKHANTGGSSGSTSSSSSSGGSGGGQTLTVGVLTDLTGPAASGNKTSVLGAKAGAVVASADGINIKIVQGDSQTSPSSVLTAAKTLVEQDHVNVVLAVSALTFGAADYLTQKGIPVVGVAEDGSEWVTHPNMFSAYGFVDSTKVSTTAGLFFKMEGVTKVGALGYGISPQSANAAKGTAASAIAAGLQAPYLNANFQFGGTNVAPIALQMKADGVDGFTSTTDPNTSFALITGLKQAGATPKVALLPDGYGGDLLQAGPGALQSGQGVYFSLSFEPVEMHTAATDKFQNALKSVGVTGDPTYAEYSGYASMALLVQALKTAGPNPSSSAIISALGSITSFNADGLLGSHHLSMADRAASATGTDSCLWVTKLSGSGFVLVPGADPICGAPIPGKTV